VYIKCVILLSKWVTLNARPYITFSKTFEMDVSKGIGLKLIISILSLFLCKGFISENFNWEGKMLNESDLLHMYVRGDVMKGVLIEF
jgi:hypothetical protein